MVGSSGILEGRVVALEAVVVVVPFGVAKAKMTPEER